MVEKKVKGWCIEVGENLNPNSNRLIKLKDGSLS